MPRNPCTISMTLSPHIKAHAVLSAAMILAFHCCSNRAYADIVKYLVYVDETGTAFYFSSDLSHVSDKTACTKFVPGPVYQCPLNYTKPDGVPTITSRDGVAQIKAGDILIREPDPNSTTQSTTNSDLVKFVDSGTHPKTPGADKTQFFSKPDDTDTDGSTDKDFSTDVKTSMPEVDLGSLPKFQVKGKLGVDLPLPLAGKWGVYYGAKPGDIGGYVKGDASEVIGYIFVSDTDQVVSKGKSVRFDAGTSQLSFANDFVTGTGSSGDPLVGAAVNMPAFVLQGMTANGGVLFNPLAGGQMTLSLGASTYLEATVGSLTYTPSENLFSAVLSNFSVAGVDPTSPLYDPSLAAVDSPFLQ